VSGVCVCVCVCVYVCVCVWCVLCVKSTCCLTECRHLQDACWQDMKHHMHVITCTWCYMHVWVLRVRGVTCTCGYYMYVVLHARVFITCTWCHMHVWLLRTRGVTCTCGDYNMWCYMHVWCGCVALHVRKVVCQATAAGVFEEERMRAG